MSFEEKSIKMHQDNKGKIEVISKVKIESRDDLSIAYTPGVAEPCRRIHSNKEDVYKYTSKGNLVAIVTDGSAVLGLGNIGPEASMPVMEGKAVLFKEFANVDAIPICLDTQDVEEIIKTVKLISPTFGGINLEDISSPRCIEIENRLKEELQIPVFHDDQHGTAIVVVAALINSLKVTNKRIENVNIVVSGAGAAGSAIVKMLINLNPNDILVCDIEGILHKDIVTNNWLHKELAFITNKNNKKGTLKDALKDSDVFIGVSAGNILNEEMVNVMNKDSIVFAMANPIPEIMPDVARKGGAKIIGTGRSDFDNQINNVLAFPGIFRGALDVRASVINEEMKVAAAYAIADLVSENELNENYIIPNALDKRVSERVSKAVIKAAKQTKVNRI